MRPSIDCSSGPAEQTPSERLATQILLPDGYRDIDPIHPPPRGPDGCRDADAVPTK